MVEKMFTVSGNGLTNQGRRSFRYYESFGMGILMKKLLQYV